MAEQNYKPLWGESFRDSFLMEVTQRDWPNEHLFFVWSYRDQCSYRITTSVVLEFHYLSTGTGRLGGAEIGIPLDDICITHEEEFEYWSDRVAAYREQGYDSGEPPICIEFSSHLFANRKRQFMTRNRNTGLLVVCRSVYVEEDPTYPWPIPTPVSLQNE
ncbi:hypothetical protein [Blastopirellula marina]|uniref:Uncharacterized protein n=1 Tax=Blastopirellula marina TaxID=124 RepID=A0A2S8GMJ4_9BACT|nr:hypothetical protein [Blastopirellula marina]PQO45639.1 hypothetical protein C5Y93_14480 [Blastopirellula marina]